MTHEVAKLYKRKMSGAEAAWMDIRTVDTQNTVT